MSVCFGVRGDWCARRGLRMVALAMALNLWRLVRGPDLPDRILALDTLGNHSSVSR